jgi:endonuclease G, mitochondrial
MKSNNIILLLIFFGIAYFLYHKNKKGPLSELGTTVSDVFQGKNTASQQENPYKAPENDVLQKTKESVEAAVLGKVKDVFEGTSDDENVASASANDLDNFIPKTSFNVEVVRHQNYYLGYSEKHEAAAWTLHILTREDTYGEASRSGLEFRPDNKVSTKSALSSDYSRSGYDRGHLVPAGDFKCCQEKMNETFLMSNVCPQDRDMNRYSWNEIENLVRRWAKKYDKLYVFTGAIFEGSTTTIGRYNKITVPTYFYKIVVYYPSQSSNETKAIGFLVKNTYDGTQNPKSFAVSVDEIEQRSGIDFLHQLPNRLEQMIEANSKFTSF